MGVNDKVYLKLKSEFPNLIFKLKETKDTIYLNMILVPYRQRRKGKATKFMKRLIELSKKYNKKIILNVSDMYADEDDPKADDLQRWYTKLGFKMTDSLTKEMSYTP